MEYANTVELFLILTPKVARLFELTQYVIKCERRAPLMAPTKNHLLLRVM